VSADIIHLSAMAIWLGGLAMLVTIVLRRPRPPGRTSSGRVVRSRDQAAAAEAAKAVARFSPIALSCVCAIVVTGTYQAWRNVGTLGALTGTTYGRLLLAKIAGMCVLIGLGYLARSRVASLRTQAAMTGVAVATALAVPVKVSAGVRPSHGRGGPGARPGRGGPGSGERAGADGVTTTLARLRWSVTVEAAIALAVLAVTAVLVNTPTGRESFAPPARATVAFDTGGPDGRGSIGLTVTPARLGSNQVRVSLTGSTGKPYRPQQIQAALSLPARHLGPLPVPLTPKGGGRYLGGPVTVTITGQWQLQITIRSDAFDETTVTVPVAVH
jgi:copper transport protein